MSRMKQLQPGEAIPAGKPRKYPDTAGYIRLRWSIGQSREVETREHRVFEGRVLPSRVHVHHINGIKSDNRPENLMLVTHRQHGQIHHPRGWDLLEAHKMYEDGASLPMVAKEYGRHCVTIMRAFKDAGLTVRTLEEAWEYRADKLRLDETEIVRLLKAGTPVARIATKLGISRGPIDAIRTRHNIPPFRPGRQRV